ncbi:MAG TPA: hypothetical protein DCR04_03005 [Flavobacteriales bacterium]|nr:hypothetical protein [Flavobacteriales bacterium]
MKITFFSVSFFLAVQLNAFGQSDDMSYTDCVEKYRSAWGEDCSQCPSYNDSYVVYLKNTCDQAIDVLVCVQEDTEDWKRFQHTSVASGDSIRAYACVGTGKYLAWARRAGDESVIFPSIEQVNAEY